MRRFMISSVLTLWDASYVLLRPHSMEGGAIDRYVPFLWFPYRKYGRVDKVGGCGAYLRLGPISVKG